MNYVHGKYIIFIILTAIITSTLFTLGLKNISSQKIPIPEKHITKSDNISKPTITYQPSVSDTPAVIPTNKILPTKIPTPTPNILPTLSPTPTVTPVPTPTPILTTSQMLDDWFTKYANSYSVDRQKLWTVAVCESDLRPNATNGLYGGLYQFSPAAWKATRIHMNLDPNPDLRFNAEESIKTAAFKISVSGLQAWPNCGK